ncbi:MAG TPA: NB-ARC domain-containing protein [Ktedonobacterales bacterium]|nr:NB-ARC domain-containing protein [Ktedonobacterales bacterium]
MQLYGTSYLFVRIALTGQQTVQPAIKSKLHRQRPRWQRLTISAGAGLVLLLGGALGKAALSQAAPHFLDHLPGWLASLYGAPWWMQVLITLGLGALAFGVAWVLLAERQRQQTEGEEQTEQEHAAQSKLLREEVGTHVQTMDEHLVSGFKEVAGLLKQPPAPSTKETPPNVSAPSGLPRAVAFIGREQTLASLMADLRQGRAVGVFALFGMGGVGKTALAAEAVAQLSGDMQTFPGGTAWVPCEDAQGAAGLNEVWVRVARALNLSQVAAMPDEAQRRAALQMALMEGPLRLLALDNVDGLKVEELLETLMIQGHTVLLLTARQKVAPHRLHVLELAPLEPPDARALFLRRLHENDPARPTPVDETDLDGLLELVGGLPLAIELSAAYAGEQGLPLWSVRQEVERDGIHAEAFKDLASPAARRALSACFDRSWRRLNERQQQLFAGLSLLEGPSFPRAAALALAEPAAKGTGRKEPASIPAGDLARLLTSSLVERLPNERLRLHPLLRDYAVARLTTLPAEQVESLGAAVLVFWLAYIEAHPGYEGMDTLEVEAPGLLSAVAWAHNHALHSMVLNLASKLSRFWFARSRIDDAKKALPWALEAAQALNDLEAERWATHEQAELDRRLGQLKEARAGFDRTLELAHMLSNPAAEEIALHQIALLDVRTGRLTEARAGYERALALARQLGDLAAEQQELHGLAVLDARTGHLDEARTGHERALALARQISDPVAEAEELRNIGAFIGQRGEPERGRTLIKQSLTICEKLGDVNSIGECFQFLAWIDEKELSMRKQAIQYYREALRCFEQVQSPSAEDVRVELRRLGEQA